MDKEPRIENQINSQQYFTIKIMLHKLMDSKLNNICMANNKCKASLLICQSNKAHMDFRDMYSNKIGNSKIWE